ncbi:hypothetical protein POM88_031598 [Heracleum sosnowskyi]|uniref:Uncharacterized protein n=1 Tax=Heracleum sosnowskyi TaxID=360622 RepID=A0AAD8MGS1_9APIA|nr:hypothetical protein POM88_031598 [Heracleum sosnowskyi]
MLLNDRYFDLGSMVLNELAAKLGNKRTRNKNIYFARFIMLLANHVVKDLVIANPTNKMVCLVQNRRVLEDLNRKDLNNNVEMVYLPIIEANQVMQVSSITTATSQPPISLPSSATMETVNVQQAPTQVAKTKGSKPKSKRPTSGASQKTPVAKTISQPEGSEQVVVRGEGRGEHQRNPKDKAGEVSESQPSHHVSSQKDELVEKEVHTSLVASSKKDFTIEKSSQPGTQNKRDRDTRSPKSISKAYERRKRVKTTEGAQGIHTVQTKISDFVSAPSQSQVDVALVDVESQPHSLNIQIETETPNSPTLSGCGYDKHINSRFSISQILGGAPL